MQMRAKLIGIVFVLFLTFISGCSSVVDDQSNDGSSASQQVSSNKLHQVQLTSNNIDVNQTATQTLDDQLPISTGIFGSSFGGGDLWSDLRDDFKLDHYEDQPTVQQELTWYLNHKDKLYFALNNSAPYMYYILQEVKARNLPGEFALLPIIESAYDPFATSDRGAAGLWQLMPQTADNLGLRSDFWYNGRRDIYGSTQAALNYLSYLSNFFNDNWLYVIAAYDTGEGNIQRDIQYNAVRGLPTDFWSLPLPHETTYYVPELLALAIIIKHPDRYGITLPPLKDGPYFQSVNVNSQLDLKNIAKLADTSVSDIEQLNTGLSREETDPHLLNRILLPIDKITVFEQNLLKASGNKLANNTAINNLAVNNLPTGTTTNTEGTTATTSLNVSDTSSTTNNDQAASTNDINVNNSGPVQYTVQHGDNLFKIARHFQTSVATIVALNHIRRNNIHPGQVLMVSDASNNNATSEVDNNNTASNQQNSKISSNDLFGQQRIPITTTSSSNINTPIVNTNSRNTVDDQTKNTAAITHYTIRPGDNLWLIARKLGVSADKIKTWNQIYSTRDLRPGRHLVIYQENAPAPIDNNLPQAASHSVSKQQITNTTPHISYKVKPGDTLSTIAHRFDINMEQIKNANKLDTYQVKVGQTLIIS